MLMKTALGQKLLKAKLLSDSVAWFDAIDGRLRAKILDLIQNKQLVERGINEDGNEIGQYSLATEFISGGKKKFGDHYTLKDSGAFFNSMFVVVLSDSFIIDGDGNKGEDDLFVKFGDGIIGLTDENMEIVKEEIRKKYIIYARRILQIN